MISYLCCFELIDLLHQPTHHSAPRRVYAASISTKYLSDDFGGLGLYGGQPECLPRGLRKLVTNPAGCPMQNFAPVFQFQQFGV